MTKQFFSNKVNTGSFIIFPSLLLLIFLTRCANVVAPSGGPKDDSAAVVKSTRPENGTINFKGNTIIFEFNELIKLDNINSKAIISPNINTNNISYKTDKKRLIITMDSLLDNTTYSLTFPECIKDITEGNSQVYQIAFSTGPYLDSISVRGSLQYASGTPVREGSVALYKGKIDSSSLASKPVYLTKAKNGSYQLNNLKADTYTEIAWVDDNKNGQWDKSKEKVSFRYPVTTDSNSTQNLTLSKYDDKAPKYSYSQKFNYVTVMNFDEALYLFKSNPYIPYRINKEQVELFSDKLYQTRIEYTVLDSSFNEKKDTTTIEFKESKIASGLDWSLEPNTGKLLPGDSMHLLFSKPIKSILNDSITINIPFTIYHDTVKHRISFVPKSFSDSIKVKLGRGAFISINGDSSRAQKATYLKANIEDYGSISYEVVSQDTSFIIHLTNKKGIVHTTINKREHTFSNLLPDTYSFIYIHDTNNNHRWDDGDVFTNTQPEKITYLKKTVVLKANWEIKGHKIDSSEQ